MMLRRWVLFGVFLALTGCTVYRHAAPPKPPDFTAAELGTRLHLKVGVLLPSQREFEVIPQDSIREREYKLAVQGAQRLVSVLAASQIVDSVEAADSDQGPYDVILASLPLDGHSTGMDSPAILMYGGVLPQYSKADAGVRFRFVKGGSGEFTFNWTQSELVALWAPVMAVSPEWQISRESSTYWRDLRTALLAKFSSLQQP